MTQRAVGAPFGERDLGDEIGAYPVRALRLESARRVHERRVLALPLLELRRELAQRRLVESGADFPRIAKLAVVVHAEQQRPEARARTLWVGEAADDHLLPAHALHFHPVARARAGGVDRIGFLADRTLEPERARLAEEIAAAAAHFRAEPHRSDALADDLVQPPLALGERRPAQIVAIAIHEIEGEEREAAAGAPVSAFCSA